MIVLWLTTGIIAATSSAPPVQPTGADFGWGSSVQKVGDTRWEGVRRAREEAAAAFREVPATPVARRKEAAVRASEAVAKVARSIRPQTPSPAAQIEDGWDGLLQDLEALQAQLAGMIDADRIRMREARAAAEMWAMIERELRAQALQEEELMVVLALAL